MMTIIDNLIFNPSRDVVEALTAQEEVMLQLPSGYGFAYGKLKKQGSRFLITGTEISFKAENVKQINSKINEIILYGSEALTCSFREESTVTKEYLVRRITIFR